jgi:hypothetical protein
MGGFWFGLVTGILIGFCIAWYLYFAKSVIPKLERENAEAGIQVGDVE